MNHNLKLSKACIYGIRCNTTGLLYIGSTSTCLKSRLSRHITDLRGYMGYLNKHRAYRSSFEVLFNDNYEIFKIEDYPTDNKHELEIRETLHICNNVCCNKKMPRMVNLDNYDLSALPSVLPCTVP